MDILIEDYTQGKKVTPLPNGLGSFTWKTKVQDLFSGDNSEWKLKDDWASQKVNIRDILAHVSGLPWWVWIGLIDHSHVLMIQIDTSHDLSYGLLDAPIDLVRKLRYLRPQFELRKQWMYNNQVGQSSIQIRILLLISLL